MRTSTAVHPAEYCCAALSLSETSPTPVTLGLPLGPKNEEVSRCEKDWGQEGPEAEAGEWAFAERYRPHRPRLEAQRPGQPEAAREGASPGRTSRECLRRRPLRYCSPAEATSGGAHRPRLALLSL